MTYESWCWNCHSCPGTCLMSREMETPDLHGRMSSCVDPHLWKWGRDKTASFFPWWHIMTSIQQGACCNDETWSNTSLWPWCWSPKTIQHMPKMRNLVKLTKTFLWTSIAQMLHPPDTKSQLTKGKSHLLGQRNHLDPLPWHLRLTPHLRNLTKLGQVHSRALCGCHLSLLWAFGGIRKS